MKRGDAFTPDGPLTLGDLRDLVFSFYGTDLEEQLGHADDARIVEIRTPMGPDRRQVTLTVTEQRWRPPVAANSDAGTAGTGTEGTERNG